MLSNLRVRTKLMLLVALVVAGQLISSAFSYRLTEQIRVGGPMYDEFLAISGGIEDIEHLRSDVHESETLLLAAALYGPDQPSPEHDLIQLEARADFRLAALQRRESAESVTETIDRIDETWAQWKTVTHETLLPELMRAPSLPPVESTEDHDESARDTEAVAPPPAWDPTPDLEAQAARLDAVSHDLDLVSSGIQTQLGALEAKQLDRVRNRMLLGLVFNILSVIVFSVLAVMVARTLTEPLSRVVQRAEAVAKGHLSQRPLTISSKDEFGQLATHFNEMLRALGAINESARRIGQGQLRTTVQGDGDLADSFRLMVRRLRSLVAEIRTTAFELSMASRQILDSTTVQQRGASHQSAAAEETQRSLDSLVGASRQIDQMAGDVLRNARDSVEHHELIGVSIRSLVRHTHRIGVVLEEIRDIAHKTEHLALNAALEGVRAGEVGRGFSLVAAEMTDLSSKVMEAVRDVQQLTEDIRKATAQTVEATERGTHAAEATTQSAHSITGLLHQQQTGLEQVAQAMDDVLRTSRDTADATDSTQEAAEALTRLADRLEHSVAQFSLEHDAPTERGAPARGN